MTEFLFLDLDDTILDFHKAERIALSKTLRDFGVEPAEEVLALYHKINLWHWEQLEKGKLTRDEVQVGRFAALLRELGVGIYGMNFFASVVAAVYSEGMARSRKYPVTSYLVISSIPLLPGALKLAESGILPAGAYRNMAYVRPRLSVADTVPQALADLIADPQTSGGLLFAVDPADAATLEQELRAAGLPASIVGEILPKQEIEITVTDK